MINREVVLQTLKCPPNEYPKLVEENCPHVLERIVELWNSPDAEAYLADLLNPTCSGGRFDRDGFSKQVWQEILRLDALYKKRPPKK